VFRWEDLRILVIMHWIQQFMFLSYAYALFDRQETRVKLLFIHYQTFTVLCAAKVTAKWMSKPFRDLFLLLSVITVTLWLETIGIFIRFWFKQSFSLEKGSLPILLHCAVVAYRLSAHADGLFCIRWTALYLKPIYWSVQLSSWTRFLIPRSLSIFSTKWKTAYSVGRTLWDVAFDWFACLS